jgi:RNA polymerase sigma factor (sigma-70 family)
MKRLTENQKSLAAQAAIKSKGVAERYKKLCGHKVADDIESAASWGAMRAAATYDSGGKHSIQHWAKLKAKGSVLNTIKTEARHRCSASIDALENSLVDDRLEALLRSVEIRETVRMLLGKLTERQRQACDLFYLQGKSQQQIAEAMQCGRQHVNSLLSRAMDRLKELSSQ